MLRGPDDGYKLEKKLPSAAALHRKESSMPWDKTESRSLKVRQKIGHPVIDGDGHTQEYHPEVIEYFREVAGPDLTERYVAKRLRRAWHSSSPEERMYKRIGRPPFWTMPAKNTIDLATAMLPDLFRARFDDIGIDYAVVYTSQFHLIGERDDEIRRAGCRAVNLMNHDRFKRHADRMTPAAVIPMHTPEEAIEELEFCVKELGYKAVMIDGIVSRAVPVIEDQAPELARYSQWMDSLAIDSPYDYDPFWRKCVELKVSPTSHASGQRWGSRNSVTSYTYNHIGAFAAAGEAFCKALFLGGVTHRFPELRFCLLEGGVNWAVSLYNDLYEHWEKRSIDALREWLDPRQIDRPLLAELMEKYGGKEYAPYLERFKVKDNVPGARPGLMPDLDCIDDWECAGIKSKQNIHDKFIPRFFFGCEADDLTIANAFNTKVLHGGARLQALFSSDVAHWDVPDMTETLAESYELVEDGLITDDDFRDFTFTNMVRLHTALNRDFFKGTVIEAEAGKLLASEAT
jgi:predicted TIM-barrel fold metal-dependent hydrolase